MAPLLAAAVALARLAMWVRLPGGDEGPSQLNPTPKLLRVHSAALVAPSVGNGIVAAVGSVDAVDLGDGHPVSAAALGAGPDVRRRERYNPDPWSNHTRRSYEQAVLFGMAASMLATVQINYHGYKKAPAPTTEVQATRASTKSLAAHLGTQPLYTGQNELYAHALAVPPHKLAALCPSGSINQGSAILIAWEILPFLRTVDHRNSHNNLDSLGGSFIHMNYFHFTDWCLGLWHNRQQLPLDQNVTLLIPEPAEAGTRWFTDAEAIAWLSRIHCIRSIGKVAILRRGSAPQCFKTVVLSQSSGLDHDEIKQDVERHLLRPRPKSRPLVAQFGDFMASSKSGLRGEINASSVAEVDTCRPRAATRSIRIAVEMRTGRSRSFANWPSMVGSYQRFFQSRCGGSNITIKGSDFGNMSYPQQISLMRRADVVVQPHGAGLINTIYQCNNTVTVQALGYAMAAQETISKGGPTWSQQGRVPDYVDPREAPCWAQRPSINFYNGITNAIGLGFVQTIPRGMYTPSSAGATRAGFQEACHALDANKRKALAYDAKDYVFPWETMSRLLADAIALLGRDHDVPCVLLLNGSGYDDLVAKTEALSSPQQALYHEPRQISMISSTRTVESESEPVRENELLSKQ